MVSHLRNQAVSFVQNNPAESLARFFSGVPLDDNERVELADFMFQTAFLWLLIHEESHYYSGHVHFRAATNKDAMMGERQIHSGLPGRANKVFEWQADDSATGGVLDVLSKKDNLEKLPRYCRGNKIWLLRLIQVSIGCALLVIHKTRHRYGVDDHYPSIPTRLASIFVSSYRRLFGDNYQGDLTFLLTELQEAWYGAVDDISNAEGLAPVMQPLEPDGNGGRRPRMSKDGMGLWSEPWEIFVIATCFGRGMPASPEDLRLMYEDDVPEMRAPGVAAAFYNKWFQELSEILLIYLKIFEHLKPFRGEATSL